MDIYHITYAPEAGSVQLHFWGCNINCRACLLRREIYDCHLAETKDRLKETPQTAEQRPEAFLDLEQVMGMLGSLERVREVILMGAEPSLDPELPLLTARLHQVFGCRNILLTNGFSLPDLTHIDEVVFSIKAFTDSLHRDYTGFSNRKALANFLRLYRTGTRLR
ncbi:MAG: radical SAM protein, partial [Dehalococcoidales bacterium]|nr:radical SAM protein [Dehalococcoidales bacterium]